MSSTPAVRWFSVLSLLMLVILPPAAWAQDIPLRITYEATFVQLPSTNPATVELVSTVQGAATHLGTYEGTFPHQVNLAALTFAGQFTMTAANGDLLFVDLEGEVIPLSQTQFELTYAGTVTGGTGRFEGATGVVSGPGTVDFATGSSTAQLAGALSLRRP